MMAATYEYALEEPPLKSTPTDFDLCVLCQEKKKKQPNLVHNISDETYRHFIICADRWTACQSLKYATATRRISGYTWQEIKRSGAKWHRTCYAEFSNKVNINRAEQSYRDSLARSDVNRLPRRTKGRPSSSDVEQSEKTRLTRSGTSSFNRNLCFFCQSLKKSKDKNKNIEALSQCRSRNVGDSIIDIVNKSDNEQLKVRLADVLAEGDFHARDIVYLSSCKLAHWSRYVQAPGKVAQKMDGSETANFIAAEVEFYSILKSRLDEEEYVDLQVVEKLYNSVMLDNSVSIPNVRRPVLKEKILKNIQGLCISELSGNKPSVLCSTAAHRSAVGNAIAEKDLRGDIEAVFKCAKIVRHAIAESRKNQWAFAGSLENSNGSNIPPELMNLIRWILQGVKHASTDIRNEALKKSCCMVSHLIMQEFKTNAQVSHIAKSESTLSGFHQKATSPFSVGLSFWMYHNLRSERAVNILNKCCVAMPYNQITHICSKIVAAVQMNIKEHGVYVPPGIVKNVSLRASADNIDKQVDTYDAKNSFHGLEMSIHQQTTVGEPVVTAPDLYTISPTALHGVPKTVIDINKCCITGNPKPHTSPQYETYTLGMHEEEFSRSLKNDVCWLFSRSARRRHPLSIVDSNFNSEVLHTEDYCPFVSDTLSELDIIEKDLCASNENDDIGETYSEISSDILQCIPIWSAYNSLLMTSSSVIPDKVFSLPIINAPAHD